MGAEDGEVYILRPDEAGDGDDDEDAWVTPQPASDVILQEVADEVDADADDFDDLDEYVDLSDLAAVFDGENPDEDAITFDVVDHEVTVDESGDIHVQSGD
jgi:hypothetical protein